MTRRLSTHRISKLSTDSSSRKYLRISKLSTDSSSRSCLRTTAVEGTYGWPVSFCTQHVTIHNLLAVDEKCKIPHKHVPTKIAASPVCAAGRDRLFWIDFQLQPLEDETLIKGTTRNEFILEPDPERVDFWDEGWGPTQLFVGTMPTVQGWQTWTKEPKVPRGIHIRSKEAIERWKKESWSSAITF